jgi:hypothetical protein
MTSPDTLRREFNSSRAVRRAVKSLPEPVPPAELQTRLRVVASREAARRRALAHRGYWLAELRGWCGALMRPLAIPTAGGFASALVLFAMLAPSLIVREVANAQAVEDVPTVLYTDPTVKSYLPMSYEGHDVVVDVSVDVQGRLLDYAVSGTNSPAILKSIQSHLLTMHFNPATTFGQPTSGRVRIFFRTSRIDVKG